MKLERLSAKIFTHWQAIWMIFTNQTAVNETFPDEWRLLCNAVSIMNLAKHRSHVCPLPSGPCLHPDMSHRQPSPAQRSPACCSSDGGRPAHCLSSSPAQPSPAQPQLRTTQLHQLILSTLSICSPVWGGKSASYHPLNKRQKTRNKRQGIKD